MTARKNGQKTKERILEVAADLFANQGFYKTTVEEISRRARCNIAAINYHFGSKANLYTETWRYIHHLCQPFYASHQPASDLPAEERLRGYIFFLLKILSNEDELEKLHMLNHREFISPTGLVDDLWREMREPLQRKLQAAIKEIMGPQAGHKDVEFCEKMVVDMCRGVLLPNRRHDQHFFEGLELTDEELERMADRYIRFCLPGIRSFCAG
jgi:AcrR family transcriptional regulator